MPEPPPLPPPVRELMRRNNTIDVHDPTGSRVVGAYNPGPDDPVVIYVDLNQDGVFSNADGEQILYRPCCGDGYVAVNIAPGTYGYMATHAERGTPCDGARQSPKKHSHGSDLRIALLATRCRPAQPLPTAERRHAL